jgi:hypothetical protein
VKNDALRPPGSAVDHDDRPYRAAP